MSTPVPCDPEKSPCSHAGLTMADWFYSIFKIGCNIKAWLASIRNVLNVTNDGYVTLAPSYLQIDNPGTAKVVTIPSGAMFVQATIDNEYAAVNRLEIWNGSAWIKLPAGADYQLPVITPVLYAASDGSNGARGTGAYGEVKVKFAAGSYGFVEAIYRTTAKTITAA